MRKPTRKSMTNKLDKICSELVRMNPCAKCGEVQYDKLQCAHIFSRTYRSVRWNPLNLLSLCASCHFWAHKNPLLFTEFVKTHLGDINYEYLKSVATPIAKFTIPDMVTLYEAMKKRKEDL